MPPLYADIIFPEARRQLTANPLLTHGLRGLFTVDVTRGGKHVARWHLMFPGSADQPPLITNDESAWSNSKHAATVPSLPTVHFTLDDRDLLKLATGGMSGVQAITERRVKVKGDLMLAKSMQRVFREAGGVERVLKYMRENAVPIKGTKGNAVPARKDGKASSKAKPHVKAKSKL